MTTDKGSEIWEMVRMHERLRCSQFISVINLESTYHLWISRLEAAPEFTIEQWPAAIQVQSGSTIRQSKVSGDGSVKERVIVFEMLYLSEKQTGCSMPTTNCMCKYHTRLAVSYEQFSWLFCVDKYSIGFGPLSYRNGLTRSVNIGTIIAFLRRNARYYPRELRLVKCGWCLNRCVQHHATALFAWTQTPSKKCGKI